MILFADLMDAGTITLIGAAGAALGGGIGVIISKLGEAKRNQVQADAMAAKVKAETSAALEKLKVEIDRQKHADSIGDYRQLYETVKAQMERDRATHDAERERERANHEAEKAQDYKERREEVHAIKNEWQVRINQLDLKHREERKVDNEKCETQLNDLRKEVIRLTAERGEMLADIRGLQSHVRYMETYGGVGPTLTQPGVIVAGVDGIIHIFSPSLTGFTGWKPEDVEGNLLTVLMLNTEVQKFQRGMRAVLDGSRKIDPLKGIDTSIKRKDGKEVHVTIYLNDKMMKDMKLITAYVQERPMKVAKMMPASRDTDDALPTSIAKSIDEIGVYK